MKRAAFVAFAVAGAAGLALAATVSWWLLVVGAASIAAAWFYTGGPRPYGYLGLGEVFVFVFFGLVATVGTTYVAVEAITGVAWVMGCGVGALACALLVVNNLRDIPTDTVAGKRTLAVRLGDAATRASTWRSSPPRSSLRPWPPCGGRRRCWPSPPCPWPCRPSSPCGAARPDRSWSPCSA